MAFVEHLPGFFGDHGTDAIIDGTSVTGIFDIPAQDAFGIVASAQPSLLLPTESVGSAIVGDPVVIGAVSYTIAGVEPDGTGITRLVLKS